MFCVNKINCIESLTVGAKYSNLVINCCAYSEIWRTFTCLCISGPSKTSLMGCYLTAVMKSGKAMNTKSSEEHYNANVCKNYMLFKAIEKKERSVHRGFPCVQIRQGLGPPLIVHLKWFPHYLYSGSWGVWSRRPGKGCSYPLLLCDHCAAAYSKFHVSIM